MGQAPERYPNEREQWMKGAVGGPIPEKVLLAVARKALATAMESETGDREAETDREADKRRRLRSAVTAWTSDASLW